MPRGNFLKKALDLIDEVEFDRVRKNYRRALERSIEVHYEKAEKNPSVKEIEDIYAIDPKVQFQHLIAIDKRKAKLFLKSCGMRLSLHQIRNKLSRTAYL